MMQIYSLEHFGHTKFKRGVDADRDYRLCRPSASAAKWRWPMLCSWWWCWWWFLFSIDIGAEVAEDGWSFLTPAAASAFSAWRTGRHHRLLLLSRDAAWHHSLDAWRTGIAEDARMQSRMTTNDLVIVVFTNLSCLVINWFIVAGRIQSSTPIGGGRARGGGSGGGGGGGGERRHESLMRLLSGTKWCHRIYDVSRFIVSRLPLLFIFSVVALAVCIEKKIFCKTVCRWGSTFRSDL